MKIIDEKGRLFGKINVIDFLVIMFLFCFVPMFYFGYKFLTTKEAARGNEFITIEANCQLIKLNPGLLKDISVGDKELDENNQVIGEIVSLGQSEPYKYTFDVGEGQKIIKEDPTLKQVNVKIKLKTNIKKGCIYYKNRQILANSPIEFRTNKYIVEAIPYAEDSLVRVEKLELNVVLKDLDEKTVRLISVGDKEIDANGGVIAEIIKIGKTQNNTYDIKLGTASIVLGEDSSKKEMFVKIKLKCDVSRDGRLYFKEKEIKYDSLLEFQSNRYTVKFKLAQILLNEKWVELRVKFSGMIPELATVVTEGDIEKDTSGRLVGRLKKIISNTPTEMQAISLQDNKFVSISQPFQRDIIATLNLLCTEKEGMLYFKNNPVKIGNMITFTTNLYSAMGIIVGLESQ